MTLKTRVDQLEQREADALIASLVPLAHDRFFARLAARHIESLPGYLYLAVKEEIKRRACLMTEEEADGFLCQYSTPDEYAAITAKMDAELAAFEAELAREYGA